MKYYRPPLVLLVVLNLQRVLVVPTVLSPVLVKWSPVPVVTASMSKSAQVALVGYGQMSVMLQSLPASCGLPDITSSDVVSKTGLVFCYGQRSEKCKGGVPHDGATVLVWESMMGGGNGSEWEVDAALALIWIIAAR
ncbi:hypothetical protein Tco_0596866 [Tanacetum coccineum]